MPEISNEIYKTKDLYEAALIYAKGQKLLNLEGESEFYWFVFEDKKTCEKLANKYWQGSAIVNAKTFADAIRTLKDRIFAQK